MVYKNIQELGEYNQYHKLDGNSSLLNCRSIRVSLANNSKILHFETAVKIYKQCNIFIFCLFAGHRLQEHIQ